VRRVCGIAVLMVALAVFLNAEPSQRQWFAHSDVSGGLAIRVSTFNGESKSYRLMRADLPSLGALQLLDSKVDFKVAADAGTVRYQGTFFLDVGRGSLSVAASPAFLASLSDSGYQKPSEDEIIELILRKITTDYVRALGLVCGNCSSVSSAFRLVDLGVDSRYLNDISYLHVSYSFAELTELKAHGIPAKFISELKACGYQLSVAMIVSLHDSGIPVAYARQVHDCGYDISAGELIQLHNNGVGTELVCTKMPTYTPWSVENLIRFQAAGVEPTYIAEMAPLLVEEDAESLIRLHNSGIHVQFMKNLSMAEGRKISANEALLLHSHGLAAEPHAPRNK